MSRLDDLQELRAGILARLEDCSSDQNYAVLGRLLADVVKQIDELDPQASGASAPTGLSEFERRMRERESGSKAARGARSSG